jgi:DNA repair exonuclease SbcCD nuclease subunit
LDKSDYKFLVISDLHAHAHKNFSRNVEGLNNRLLATLDCLKEVRALCRERDIRDVIIPGDIFDAKNRTAVVTINQVYREFKEWDNEGIHTLMIPGNHDLAIRNGSEHALEVFSHFQHFTLHQEPYKGQWMMSNQKGLHVNAIPYREDLDPNWFASPPQDVPTLCIAHGLMQGACYIPKGPALEYGQENQDHEGIPLELILQKWVSHFDSVIVGHIHYPQILGKKKHILVPGQPWQQHPHEYKQRRGVWEVSFKKTSHGWKPFYQKIPLATPPCFLKMTIDHEGNVEPSPFNLSNQIEGNIIQLTPKSIHVPEKKIRDFVNSSLKQDCFYIDVLPPNLLQHESAKERIQLDLEESPTDILEKVIHSGLVDLKGYDASILIELGSQLLTKAAQKEASD